MDPRFLEECECAYMNMKLMQLITSENNHESQWEYPTNVALILTLPGN